MAQISSLMMPLSSPSSPISPLTTLSTISDSYGSNGCGSNFSRKSLKSTSLVFSEMMKAFSPDSLRMCVQR